MGYSVFSSALGKFGVPAVGGDRGKGVISIRADLSAATDVVVDDDDDVVADGFAASKTGLALPTSCASVEDVKLGAGHRGSCCVAPQLAAGPHTQSVILTA